MKIEAHITHFHACDCREFKFNELERELNQWRSETVTEKMREAGSQIASALMQAQVAKCTGGLGGKKDWKKFESVHSGKNIDLIKQYINDDIDSVTAIYIAMRREE